jgi:hypothetical protein
LSKLASYSNGLVPARIQPFGVSLLIFEFWAVGILFWPPINNINHTAWRGGTEKRFSESFANCTLLLLLAFCQSATPCTTCGEKIASRTKINDKKIYLPKIGGAAFQEGRINQTTEIERANQNSDVFIAH